MFRLKIDTPRGGAI